MLQASDNKQVKGLETSETRLKKLRELILLESLPSDADQAAALRPTLWKLLLRLHVVPSDGHTKLHPLMKAETYLDLSSRDASSMFPKIRNDTFRTLATDLDFQDKVGEERLVRCLEAFVWRQLDKPASVTSYVQGMNVLAAPFLFVMPSELEAFACFTTLLETHAHRYVRPTLEGAHLGLQLVDKCLQALEPELYSHLLANDLTAELYAFAPLLTLSASTPPLREVLQLWDFLLAYGVGLNVLCVVAQLSLIKSDLLKSSSPMKLLRTLPPLKSREIIPLAVRYVATLDEVLFDAVVRHPWDDTLTL